jgi:hypothetical protein
VANRGRTHRDEVSPQIPVAELVGSNKRTREREEEHQKQVLAEALLNKKPRPGQSPFTTVGADRPTAVSDRSGRMATRVLGVAAALAMLAGGLIATQLFNGGDAGLSNSATGPEHIRGAKVFRPDVIRASLNTGGDSDVPKPEAWEPADGTDPGAAQAGGGDRTDRGAEAGQQSAGQAAPPAQQQQSQQQQSGGSPATTAGGLLPNLPLPLPGPATTSASSGGGGSQSGGLLGPILDPLDPITDPILGPILGFYAAAPEEPATAYGLLDTTVQDGTVDDFANSWRDVKSTEVETATPDGSNAFIVQVAMLRLDGSIMMTKQRIVVGNGPRPKIIDAQLLSVSLN